MPTGYKRNYTTLFSAPKMIDTEVKWATTIKFLRSYWLKVIKNKIVKQNSSILHKVKYKLDRRFLLSLYYPDTKTSINYGKIILRSGNGTNLKKSTVT